MKKRKILIIFTGLIFIALIILVIINFPKFVNKAVTTFYSPTFSSKSVKESLKDKKLLYKPILSQNLLEFQDKKYVIEEIWIEQITKIEYPFIFSDEERIIPIGFRLIVKVAPPLIVFKQSLLCNSIELSSGSRDDILRAEVKPPLPTTVTCEIRPYQD